jgi:DNA-binding transcriptional regulator YhcF (GntR family)
MSKPVPFSLDRTGAANLSDQLADRLRAAISSGHYRKGDILPTIVELARALGTSVQVPRAAIAALAAENLVSPRRGVGCVVVGRRQSVWKGRVLGVVPAEREGAYHTTTLLGEMRRALAAAGYLFEVVALDLRPAGSIDCGPLDLALQRNLDFAFPLFCPVTVLRRLERAKVPFATKETDSGAEIPAPAIGDMSPFLAQCRASGVSRVLVVGFGSRRSFDGLCARFADAGLEVEPRLVRCNHSAGYLERLERLGMAVAIERFSKPRATWPHLVFWADDFLAMGGLVGFLHLGISVPRDIFAVTIANKGLVPVFPRSLARFEFDPAETGRAAAAEILRRLAGEPPRPIPEVVRYVSGDTLPGKPAKSPDP